MYGQAHVWAIQEIIITLLFRNYFIYRPNIFFPRKILESLFPVGKTAAVSQLSGGTCTARDICSRSTMTTNAISQCCGKNVQSHDIKDEEESNEPGE